MPSRTNTASAETELGLLPLERRRWLHSIQLAYHLANAEGNLQHPRHQGMNTRAIAPNRKQLKAFAPKKVITERSFSYQVRKLWNSLPTTYHLAASRPELTNLLLAGVDLPE